MEQFDQCLQQSVRLLTIATMFPWLHYLNTDRGIEEGKAPGLLYRKGYLEMLKQHFNS